MDSNQTTDTATQRSDRQAVAAATYAPLQRVNGRLRPTEPAHSSSLSPEQQGLLLAALRSQADSTESTLAQTRRTDDPRATAAPSATMNGATMFMSPQNAEIDGLNGDYTPDLDYLDNDNFDFENADLGGEMIGALPGDGHEKRHSPDDKDDSDEPDPKRQETSEGGDKGAKKPGRKPLTSEPTTVSCHRMRGDLEHGLTLRSETQGTEPGGPACLPRAQREAREGLGDASSRNDEEIRSGQA